MPRPRTGPQTERVQVLLPKPLAARFDEHLEALSPHLGVSGEYGRKAAYFRLLVEAALNAWERTDTPPWELLRRPAKKKKDTPREY